ncbi:sorting nexin-33-like [Styela clava]|uniref:sorting nexin-33-like n=1 Tax=Styela clava TaxID=7725 RepID=UPI0019394ACF|nr:sorting nexin-33-like [Styela clava]
MAQRAVAIYDFDGIADNGEITLKEGEYVTILKTDVGDGWWEGMTDSGQKGLFPEAYVTMSSHENGNANGDNHTPSYNSTPYPIVNPPQDTWQQETVNDGYYNTNTAHNSYGGSQGNIQNDDNDDNWSEDWDDGQSEATVVEQQSNIMSRRSTVSVSNPDTRSVNSMKVAGTVGKNFNRFSSFVKHGGEAYVLGKADAKVRQVDQVHIVYSTDGTASWKTNGHTFTCTIENPLKKSKMKGLKSFVAYKLTPSDMDVSVQRRYKHFDWLYDRLVQRYPMLVVPRLPEKQASGRFEEDFIESRMQRLKLWVSHICRHPLLSTSSVFRNYITLTEQKAWKMAKRKAERDELLGANFFLTIDIFSQPSQFDSRDAEVRLEHFKKFVKCMDDGVSQLTSTSRDMANRHVGAFKKEFISMSRSFGTLSNAFNQHQTPESQALTDAVKYTGQTYEKIGEMFAEQPKNDMSPLLHNLWLYKGILEVFPDIWHLESGALRKVRECKRLQEEGRMSAADVDAVEERTQRITGCMQAEVTHFHKERVRDFKHMMTDMLQSQIDFYEGIVGQLRLALTRFEEVPEEP